MTFYQRKQKLRRSENVFEGHINVLGGPHVAPGLATNIGILLDAHDLL